jgi:predicted lysophospholipase L1 biosynthesis ABC-type transport system permease subunit
MTEDDLKQRFQTIEMRFRDIDTARAREREEQKREFAMMLTAARKTIEETIARSEPLVQMRELIQMNEEQVGLLRDAREERIRRSERDRVTTEEKAQAAIARAEAERAAAEDKANLDRKTAAALLEKRDRFERQMKIFAAVTTLLLALGGVAASCAGAFRTPSAAKDTTHDHAP